MAYQEPTYDCFLCGHRCKCGGGLWEADYVPKWKVMICKTCRSSNWDGIVPTSRLVAYLEGEGVPVARNVRGWIDIPR